jgi:outer membrane protein OmpA-like peptidoglycan-associated protein
MNTNHLIYMKTKSIIILTAAAFFGLAVSAGTLNVFAKPRPLVISLSKASFKKIEFDSAKPTIRSSYHSNLEQLVTTLKSGKYAVTLRGHADSIGKYKYNWVLSDNRAISVKNYLVSEGIPQERIITTPFGSTVPIASNKTAAGRQKNRRVEIEIKKLD